MRLELAVVVAAAGFCPMAAAQPSADRVILSGRTCWG
jgi:hypothetical protein